MAEKTFKTPWHVAWYDPGESMGRGSNRAIKDADGRHVMVVETGKGEAVDQETASLIVNAMNAYRENTFIEDLLARAPSLLSEDRWVAFPLTNELLAMETGRSAVRRQVGPYSGSSIFEWRLLTSQERQEALSRDVEARRPRHER